VGANLRGMMSWLKSGKQTQKADPPKKQVVNA